MSDVGELDYTWMDCIRNECLYFPNSQKREAPCTYCFSFNQFKDKTGTGRGLERSIMDEEDDFGPILSASPDPAPVAEPVPVSPTPIETRSDAKKRWQDAAKKTKENGDKIRSKAISDIIQCFDHKSIIGINPLTAPLDHLNQIGRGKGLSR